MKTLLIVEDNDVDRESLMRLVDRYDAFRILNASNVEEAIPLITKADIIILDLIMPMRPNGAFDRNAGLEILKQVKTQSLKPLVVIVSNYPEGVSEVQNYELAEFPFVKKWFHKADDREALSRFLSQVAG
jgi:CheY-like chemotaxis protein